MTAETKDNILIGIAVVIGAIIVVVGLVAL